MDAFSVLLGFCAGNSPVTVYDAKPQRGKPLFIYGQLDA